MTDTNTTPPQKAPVRKVVAGSAAGAVTVIAVWLLGLAHVDVPAEVASAATVLIGFGVAYLTPKGAGEHTA